MARTNHQVLEECVQAVFNRGDIEMADDFFDAAFTDHAPWPGQPPTVAGFKAGLSEMRRSFPDLRVEVERIVAEDDLVVGHYRMSGTHLGDFGGAAAGGKTFAIEVIDIVRMRDGRITEHWGLIDEAGLARQLGLSS